MALIDFKKEKKVKKFILSLSFVYHLIVSFLFLQTWEIYLIVFHHRRVRHAITGNKIERKLFCIQARVQSIMRIL